MIGFGVRNIESLDSVTKELYLLLHPKYSPAEILSDLFSITVTSTLNKIFNFQHIIIRWKLQQLSEGTKYMQPIEVYVFFFNLTKKYAFISLSHLL